MVFIITSIGFMLEHIFSRFLNYPPFYCLFVICTLVFIYPFFHHREANYLIYSFAVGLLYDVIFTNTFLFNAILFVILGYIIIKLNIYLINNIYSTIFMALFIIFIYLLTSYIMVSLVTEVDFIILRLLKKMYDSTLMNLLYSGVAFVIIEKISRRYKILKMN